MRNNIVSFLRTKTLDEIIWNAESLGDMLRCSGTSVVLVSQELSFEDLPTFGKFFRLHTGLSPREYQKKVLASSALSHPE